MNFYDNGLVDSLFMEFFGESDNNDSSKVPNEIKEIVNIIERKGYDVKYSSPGYVDTTYKRDRNDDGVINNKMTTTARIIFARNYRFDNTPQGWMWKILHNDSKALYAKPYTYNEKMGNPKEAFLKWKEFYMNNLKDWAEDLPKCGDAKNKFPNDEFN